MKKILIIVGIIALILIAYSVFKAVKAKSNAIPETSSAVGTKRYITIQSFNKGAPVSTTTTQVGAFTGTEESYPTPTAGQLALAAAAKRACEIKCDASHPFNATKRRECKAGC